MFTQLLGALFVVLMGALSYQWWRWQRLRRHASITDVTGWTATLLRGFAPGSVLIAEPNGREGFIQYAVTARRHELRTLEFGLPEVDWSRTAITPIQTLMDSMGISWTFEQADTTHEVQRFLRAEIHGTRAEVLSCIGSLTPRIAGALGHSTD